ncbi:autotransporter outer membrane beta-barrel domain-containing protein [Bartonella sp. B17]
MRRKNFLLSTIAGTLILSHFNLAYANTALIEHPLVEVEEGNKVLTNVHIRGRTTAVNVVGPQSELTITKGKASSELVALSASKGGRINLKEVNVRALMRGLQVANASINAKDSIVNVKSGHAAYGIIFHKGEKETVNNVELINTKLFVQDGMGIGSTVDGNVKLKNSEIRADLLFQDMNRPIPGLSVPPSSYTLTLTADHSILEGKVKTTESGTTILNLKNGSKWFLKTSENELETTGSLFSYTLLNIDERAHSRVSILNLDNSSIIFKKPIEGRYKTLTVGKRETAVEDPNPQGNTISDSDAKTVYDAIGDARIYFNLKWSDGAPKEEQETNRFLVHGNVSGSTTIYLNNPLKDEDVKISDAVPLNTRGLSLIQVSGKASENSFKLANGYTTMGGLPYQYKLNAYGTTSSRGKANVAQSLLGENENFWDFRLQNAYLDPEAKIKAVVPQVASYLVMPNVLFSAGIVDVSRQNTLLNDTRAAVSETQNSPASASKDNAKQGIFFSAYGNKATLSSRRTPQQYGYDADIHYTALQTGVVLTALENKNISANFGLLGTYGKLAFTPKDMEGAEESKLDKWSLAAYSSIQHESGIYVNALFSYGALEGNITTALIGKTANISETKTLSASATVGKKLATDKKGLVFEPQAQLVYQNLMFDTIQDVDGFKVDLGNPHQWLVRVGGQLTQTVLSSEKDHTVSFYGKLNVLKAFGNDKTVKIGDTFYLDSMGSSIEGGVGAYAQLSRNITLHGDISYQHKIQNAGLSGFNFSGKICYRF